jgi:DNA-binding transcriptional LysR family regulator
VDWDDLRYLLAAHRAGSIAGAARVLGVTKATASRRLAALESALDARLFDRTRDGLTLTAAGHAVLDAARGIDDALSTLKDSVLATSESRPQGVVRVTAPPWLADRYIIPALPELRELHPGIEVRLVTSNHLLNLGEREADLAIRNVRPTQQSLGVRKIVELGGCVYASSLYLDRRGMPGGREDLSKHDVLVYESLGGMPGFEWLSEQGTGAKVAFRANDPVALVGAASAGLGLAAVPCLLGDAEPSLRRVPALGFARCDMFLVSTEAARTAARTRIVADFLASVFERNRAAIQG